MDKNKKMRLAQINPYIETQNLEKMAAERGNVYEALYIISKRANQISTDLKSELHSKLEEFTTVTESLEEVQENREQIEISRFYERLPHPTLQALSEYHAKQIEVRSID